MTLSSQSIQDTRVYAQDTAPTDTRDGVIWVDTSQPGRPTFVYSTASSAWENIAPATPFIVTDESKTFDGSDGETVTTDGVDISGGSASLDESISWGGGGSATGVTDRRGIAIELDVPLDSVTADVFASFNGSTAYLTDTAGTLIESGAISGGSFTFDASVLTVGTRYYLVADNGGNSYSTERLYQPSWPIAGDFADVVVGVTGGTTEDIDSAWTFNALHMASPDGTVTVQWPTPTDIAEWDLATHQANPDGETATVDVLDSTGSVLLSDISRDKDISALSPSENIQLRTSLSRVDVANSPSVDYLGRRYIR